MNVGRFGGADPAPNRSCDKGGIWGKASNKAMLTHDSIIMVDTVVYDGELSLMIVDDVD